MKAKLSNFVAIDLGSSKISGIAAYVDKKGDMRVLSQSLNSASGFRSGVVIDLKAAENSIINTIYRLEKECEKNIKEIAISLSGTGSKSYYVSHKIKLQPDQPITNNEIQKLTRKALNESLIKDMEVIHCFPIEFVIDGNSSVDDPVGMYGKELWCQFHLVMVNSNLLLNITNCLGRCQLDITEVMIGIYASGLACLSNDDQNVGTLIIDIGAKTTSFAIFAFGKMVYTSHVPIGSACITDDIAKAFSITALAAEKLKVLYGGVGSFASTHNRAINMEDIDPDNSYVGEIVITSNSLSKIIEPRIEEILSIVKKDCDKISQDQTLINRVVITGGGSALRGIKDLVSKIFETQARVSKPFIIPGFVEGYNPGLYSATLGMIISQTYKNHKQYTNSQQDHSSQNLFTRLYNWVQENI